jgi:ectoine hydroxylase-related dioxygenase (phytanoyl-CoA dioxygenase family)
MMYEPEVWKKAYQDDGFVIVRDLLDPTTLAALRDGMDRITGSVERLRPHLKEKIFLERDHVKNNPQWYTGTITPEQCGTSVRQIADLAEFDPVFAELICYPPLLDVLEALFDSPEFSLNLFQGRPKAAQVGNGINNGTFHRDTPFEDFTLANSIIALLCLDEMTGANGSTAFIRGSHQVSDEEAKKPCWREVSIEKVDRASEVLVRCPAGSGIFFTSKLLHAAGHNRSDHPRRTILAEWGGPDVLPTSLIRYSCQGLKPRSKDPVYQKQIRMTFPRLFANQA